MNARLGPCERIVRIDRSGTSELPDRACVAVRRSTAALDIAPCRYTSYASAFRVCRPETAHPIRCQPKPDLLGDGGAQLLLQSEQAGRLTFVVLRPDVLLIPAHESA